MSYALWSATTQYLTGDVVLDPSSASAYQAAVNSIGLQPSLNLDSWDIFAPAEITIAGGVGVMVKQTGTVYTLSTIQTSTDTALLEINPDSGVVDNVVVYNPYQPPSLRPILVSSFDLGWGPGAISASQTEKIFGNFAFALPAGTFTESTNVLLKMDFSFVPQMTSTSGQDVCIVRAYIPDIASGLWVAATSGPVVGGVPQQNGSWASIACSFTHNWGVVTPLTALNPQVYFTFQTVEHNDTYTLSYVPENRDPTPGDPPSSFNNDPSTLATLGAGGATKGPNLTIQVIPCSVVA